MTKDPLGESSLVISPAVHPEGLLFKRRPADCSEVGLLEPLHR